MKAVRISLAMALGILVCLAHSAWANDCQRGCALQKQTCARVAHDACKQCTSVCKQEPVGPECRRACRDTYRFGRLLCGQERAACKEPCRDADRSCAGGCGATAKECFGAVRPVAKACRRDCRLAAANARVQCKVDFPSDPDPCLDTVGSQQGTCLDACGAAQEAGYEACRAGFWPCLDSCPPGEQPPEECHDLGGDLVVVGRSTKPVGFTTISWNSRFVHLGHVCGDPITLDEGALEIVVDPPGAAEFVEFLNNKHHPFTPLSPDPATGTIEPGSTVTVTFSGLHYDQTCDVFIGNSHFKARMLVDKDTNGTLESEAQLGVSIHVEAAADCQP